MAISLGHNTMELQNALDQISLLASSVEGVYGVAAWGLHDTTRPAIEFNSDKLFPTASTVKVPILYELYRQVESGKIDLSQRIEWRAEFLVPGSGVLQDLNMGLNLTVRDLATLMIVVSDNAATDMILDLVGIENVQATMHELGLTDTHVPFKIRQMLYLLAGVNPADPAVTYAEVVQILKGDFTPDPRCLSDIAGENVLTTPRNMATLCQIIGTHQNLSEASCLDMLDIMSRQKFKTRIPLHLPPTVKVAHKTGSLKGVRGDVGIVYAPDYPYVVALLSKNLSDPVDGEAKMALISKVIYDYFTS